MKELIEHLNAFLEQVKEIEQKMIEIKTVVGRISGTHETFDINSLSNKEKKILKLIADEKSASEIAQSLGLSKRTVEVHRYNIQRKLKLKSTKDLERLVAPWYRKQFRD